MPMKSRPLLAGIGALALAAVLAFLFFKTEAIDPKQSNAVLAHLRELKDIDSRWELEVLRARADPLAPPASAAAMPEALERAQRGLAESAAGLRSPALDQGLPLLAAALKEKATLVADFRGRNQAAADALKRLLAALEEILAAARESRGRGGAVETQAAQLAADATRFFAQGAPPLARNLQSAARELAAGLPEPLREAGRRLEQAAGALVSEKAAEELLYRKLAFVTAGPRVDSLTGAFNRELEARLADKELYRVYLVAYAAALLVLLGWLGTRLAASYRLLNAANLALKAANEGLEQRVAERTRELSEALAHLKESEAQLIQSEKMSSLGQMVAGVVHEINTPLAYVKNSLGTVQSHLPQITEAVAENDRLLALLAAGDADEQALNEQFARASGRMEQLRQGKLTQELTGLVDDGLYGIDQITEIVANLKDFSRLDRSKVSAVNLNENLQSTLLIARHELKHVEVKRRFGEIPAVTAAPSQLNQVFLNLITNAAQAIERPDGVISITTRRLDDEHVAVDVEDNGKGIPADIMPKIFDPFFTTKAPGKGTGLGLAIAYKIVTEHGGRITVRSTEGAGTTFTVELPVKPPAAAAT
jgi:signal transduction histidine kinase